MIDNVNQFIDSVARTDLAKAARRSANAPESLSNQAACADSGYGDLIQNY